MCKAIGYDQVTQNITQLFSTIIKKILLVESVFFIAPKTILVQKLYVTK